MKRDLGEVLAAARGAAGGAAAAGGERRQKRVRADARRRRRRRSSSPRPDSSSSGSLEDFERCGVVGERTNKLVGYLAATSRKLEQPLAVVIQSSSAAGKSSLMDAVLSLMPEEERVSTRR